ncbi:Ig-like domain-containing protein [Puia sp.]|uniref:Ig-like domain-containing protein n=1 Tax=Puia sp. TaxID=2045100 RepID=UPI002F42C8CA
MTLKLKNNDALAHSPGSNTRPRFIAMLLMSFGLLLNFWLPAKAAPGESPKKFLNFAVTQIKQNSVAATGIEDIISVTVTPWVAGQPEMTITFKVDGLSQDIVTVNGVATFHFADDNVGVYNVDIKTAGSLVANTTMTFITAPGPPNIVQSFINWVVQTNPADGTSQDVVQVVLKDKDGNAVNSNTPVYFFISSGTANMTFGNPDNNPADAPANAFTAGNQSLAYFTSTTVGSVVVKAMVKDQSGAWITLLDPSGANDFTTVLFTDLPPSDANSYIKGIVKTTAADGVGQDEVDATVKNSLGNNVPDGTVVTFTITSGTATITTTGTTVNGVAKAYFTSTVVGDVTVKATVDISGTPDDLKDVDAPANRFTTIHFTDPPPADANSYIQGIVKTTAADGTSKDEVDALVRNSLGNNVPDGTVVTFTITSGTATITTTGTTVNGVAKAYFTSTIVGDVTVTGSVDISGVPNVLRDVDAPANRYTTIHFTQPPPSASASHIVGITTTTTADGTSQNEVDAMVYTAGGAPVTSGTVTFTIKTGTATIITTGTIVNGVAIAYFTSSTVGTADVQATVDINGTPSAPLTDLNNPANNFVTINFVQGPPVSGGPGTGGPGTGGPGTGGPGTGGPGTGGPGTGGPGTGGPGTGGPGSGGTGTGSNNGITNLFIRQPFDYQLADGVKQDSLIAYITDAGGHPLEGIKVTFLVHTTPEQGTITTGNKFVGDSTDQLTVGGYARIAVTSADTGRLYVEAYYIDPATNAQVSIYVTDNGDVHNYETVHFVTAPDVTNPLTSLTTIIFEALADGTQQTEVRAHIVDLNGQAMPDQPVYFSIDSGTATIVSPQPAYTDANGDAYIYITSKTPGDVLITAVVDDKKIIFGSPARVRFAPINIYVPRVFTPNNDGTNDILKPILVGISQFHYFNIYNRWGNLIFTTQDPNQGWDGTFKGVPQPVETYLWIGEGIDVNGKKIVQRGMVSLVR